MKKGDLVLGRTWEEAQSRGILDHANSREIQRCLTGKVFRVIDVIFEGYPVIADLDGNVKNFAHVTEKTLNPARLKVL